MAKTVFRPQEAIELKSAYVLQAPISSVVPEEVVEALPTEEYSGPTADDLRREAEAFKQNWEKEKEVMLNSAKTEAADIIAKAEAAAFDEVKRKNDQALKIRQEAEVAADNALKEAQNKIATLEAQAQAKIDDITKIARKEGFSKGREEGYTTGKNEVERLIDRLHIILDRTMDKRAEILEQSEAQVIELVLLITRKVVKTISENQKNVVVSNITQAMRKLKTKSDVIIRVNLADLNLTTEHAKDLISSAENAKNVSIVEDSSVDRGGCIIETDFGEIDARIQSQLHELEEKILDISPIKSRGKVQ